MDRPNAKKYFKLGIKYWQMRATKSALAAWLCSYSLVPHRLVAFNVGRAAEVRKQYPLALRFYRIYLRQTKKAADRKAVLARVKIIEEKLTLIESKDGTVKWPEYRPPPGTTAAVAKCPRRSPDPELNKKNAGHWYGVGLKHFKAKEYLAAMSAWLCSYRIIEHHLAAYNAAKAAERAKQYVTAKMYYQEYLLKFPKAPDRASVIARIKAIRELLAKLELKSGGIREPVYKTAGASSPGVEKPKRPRSARRTLGWASVAVSGALIAVGSIFGGLALAAKSKVENAADGDPWNPDLKGPYEAYPTYTKGAWACLGVGAALLTTGIVLLVIKDKERPRVTVAPAPTAGGGFVSLSGSF